MGALLFLKNKLFNTSAKMLLLWLHKFLKSFKKVAASLVLPLCGPGVQSQQILPGKKKIHEILERA
jgi:hypothetical protein